MNRVQRIQIFLEDYKSVDPYLKNLLKDVQEDYQNELINEYLKLSRHPVAFWSVGVSRVYPVSLNFSQSGLNVSIRSSF